MKSANVFVQWVLKVLNFKSRVNPTQSISHFKRGVGLWLLVVLLGSFVSGCASHKQTVVRTKRDGAPKHVPHNLDKIPDAKPKIEPLSRSGNRFKKGNTYITKKKKYKVLGTSRHYRAKGVASWYGTQFHGRKTSSGEPYDMYAMTAAHRTLPLPTYAKVKNLDNGKSVIVKINDRGPFHGNRLIDLSYVAAHKLGVLKTGTARVEVVSVDPRDHKGSSFAKKELLVKNEVAVQSKNKSKAQLAEANTVLKNIAKRTNQSKLFVQLGRYPQKSKAEAVLKKIGPLAKMGALIRTVKSKESTHFLVRIGPFLNRESAHALRQKLVLLKLSPTVVTQE